MAGRREALRQLREHLDMLAGEARVTWWRAGAARAGLTYRDWPAPGVARALVWREVLRGIAAEAQEVQVEVWHDGTNRRRAVLFDVPARQRQIPYPEVPQPPCGAREAENVPEQGPPLLPAEPPPEAGAEVVKPPKASRPCAAHVLAELFRRQARMTGGKVVSEFYGTDHEFSVSTVEVTCAWMVKLGLLTSGTDDRGRGYGLADWSREPDVSAVLEGRG